MSLEQNSVEQFVVEGLSCPSCIRKVEGALKENPKVGDARLNLSTQRLSVEWANDNHHDPDDSLLIIDILKKIGFNAYPLREKKNTSDETELKGLLRAIAVAGFAAANVMLLSVSDWFGADMGESTRQLFKWVSALIVLPAAAYAGLPFYRSAWSALRHKRLNMEVPISVAVILACGMSLAQAISGSGETYFDAAIMLLFFLLIGRYLDRKMRASAKSTAQNLVSHQSFFANVLNRDGSITKTMLEHVKIGDSIIVGSGERVPIDGCVIMGKSQIDASLITGETTPEEVCIGSKVYAGTINLGQPIDVKVEHSSGNTTLDEIIHLMENAEQNRAKYVRLADKAAGIYAPLVHLMALLTFLAWFFIAGIGWQSSLITAISVLIITCPCALGLAVPVVQVVASGRLFKAGVLLKSPDGLERLAEIDTVVFDKTGSLTLGTPQVDSFGTAMVKELQIAMTMASRSAHPLSRAFVAFCEAKKISSAEKVEEIEEEAGLGLRAIHEGCEYRLGNRKWCNIGDDHDQVSNHSEIWLVGPNNRTVKFTFKDKLRSDARETIDWFKQNNLDVIILSGDRLPVVMELADHLKVEHYFGEIKPQDKAKKIEELKQQGHKILMVGDGLNDAPALAAANVSISPSTAADISQTASDFVFLPQGLSSLVDAYKISQKSRRLVFTNFGFAALYNLIAVPFAALGFLTPLAAALAMSGSSIVVILNAMRLNLANPVDFGRIKK